MDIETLKALKGSIKKWERIVEGTGVDEGADNCPLCEIKHVDKKKMKVYCATCKELAQKELDFLRSLLPKEEK